MKVFYHIFVISVFTKKEGHESISYRIILNLTDTDIAKAVDESLTMYLSIFGRVNELLPLKMSAKRLKAQYRRNDCLGRDYFEIQKSGI
ncbi:MAG: hypothetical protein WA102_02960 [Candidatus Methanoperedens sp.]